MHRARARGCASSSRTSPPSPAERRRQVLGEVGLELERLTAERVLEAESGAVEKLTLEPVAAVAPVAVIAGDRVADGGEMGADLVRAAGLQPCLDQSVGRQHLQNREMRSRLAGAA